MRLSPTGSRRRYWVSGLLLLTGCAISRTASREGVVVFANVTLVSMASSVEQSHVTVVTEHGLITALGPRERVPIPPGSYIVDGTGKFLAPGIADMHVHLFTRDDPLSYLAHGVTTLANMDGAPWTLRWRDSLAAGTLCCGTLYTVGSTVDGLPLNWMFTTARDSGQARQIVAAQKAAGYDFIKAYSTLNRTAYAGLLNAARQAQIPVVGHLPRWIGGAGGARRGVDSVFTMGQLMVAHGEELYYTAFAGKPDSAMLPRVAHDLHAADVVVTPNLCAYSRIIREIEDLPGVLADSEAQYAPPATLNQWIPANNRYNVLNRFADKPSPKPGELAEQFRSVRNFLRLITRTLNDSGVPLILGTDSPAIGFAGQSAQDELHEFVAAGLSPYDAFRAATRNAGEFMARVHPEAPRFGVVQVGYRADLVLLDGDPLANVDNAGRIGGVMARGVWLPKTRLAQMRRVLVETYRQPKSLMLQWDSLVEAHDIAGAGRVLESTRRIYPREPFLSQWVVYTKGRQALETGDLATALAMFRTNLEALAGRRRRMAHARDRDAATEARVHERADGRGSCAARPAIGVAQDGGGARRRDDRRQPRWD